MGKGREDREGWEYYEYYEYYEYCGRQGRESVYTLFLLTFFSARKTSRRPILAAGFFAKLFLKKTLYAFLCLTFFAPEKRLDGANLPRDFLPSFF